jgi:hypothetical protein
MKKFILLDSMIFSIVMTLLASCSTSNKQPAITTTHTESAVTRAPTTTSTTVMRPGMSNR